MYLIFILVILIKSKLQILSNKNEPHQLYPDMKLFDILWSMARTCSKQKLAKNVGDYRSVADLSQEKLGINSGLGRSYISGVERCERNPSLESIERIAKALKVRVSSLTD